MPINLLAKLGDFAQRVFPRCGGLICGGTDAYERFISAIHLLISFEGFAALVSTLAAETLSTSRLSSGFVSARASRARETGHAWGGS